jgi:hypothetical protein
MLAIDSFESALYVSSSGLGRFGRLRIASRRSSVRKADVSDAAKTSSGGIEAWRWGGVNVRGVRKPILLAVPLP